MAKLSKYLFGCFTVCTLLFLFFNCYHFNEILDKPFGSFHAWRQADCLSQTYLIQKNNSAIFTPQTLFVKNDGTQIAIGEFPLINAIVANLGNLFGFSTGLYRNVVFAFFLILVWYLFQLFYLFSRRWFDSWLFTLLFSSSPILSYYAVNFLPDVPGLSLCIAGLFYILKYGRSNNWRIYFGITLIALAALIKLTFFLWLVIAAGSLILKWLNRNTSVKPSLIMMVFMYLLIVALWYKYANVMDHLHHPFIFLTETRSYLETHFSERRLVFDKIIDVWLPQVYLKAIWLFIGAMGLFGLLKGKEGAHTDLKFFTILGIIGGLFFCFIMYRQFIHHDYLWIGLMPVFIVLILPFLSWMSNQPARNIVWVQVFLAGFVILQVFQTRDIMYNRYFVFDNETIYNHHLLEIRPTFIANGIMEEDIVVSVPDPSPNITLFAMKQLGFTNYRGENLTTESILCHAAKGAKYLIVSNDTELQKDYIKPFYPFYLFSFESIYVFDLQKPLDLFRKSKP